MNNIFRFHPLERPKADSPNMLPNDERINPNIVPLERLRAMDEDTYEEVVAVWAYCCVKSEGYQAVNRVGGAGDKGRDVIAYIDKDNDIFDLYQCKHYKNSISYSTIRGEIGKLLTYTLRGDYSVPKNYYIVSPLGVSQSFFDLLRDGASELKRLLKKDWNEVYKSIISYLVTGIDDKEYQPEEKASVRKTRLNGKKEYLLDEIDKAKTKLNSLGDADYITITDKGFLDNTELQLKDFSIKLDELYEKKNKYKEDLERLLRLLKNQDLFIGKLKSLLAIYKQDLNRLDFVNSGFSMMSALGNVKCPLCGSEVAIESLMGGDSDAYEKAIEKEYANTCFKIKDIENLIASKEQDSQRTANKVGELNLELTRINNEIDEVKPNVSQLKHVFSVAQRNMEKKFKHQELERFINDKTADLQTLETLIKNCNSKSDSVEYFKGYMTHELLDEIKDTLNAWKYECDGIQNVGFDDKEFDIMIDGRARTSYGKGNRSVSTAAVMISLFDYIHEKGRAFSDILILDSPLCTKYDNKIDINVNDEDALTPKGVIDSFAKYCNDKDWKYQIIILDNKITNDIDVNTLTNINLIEFGTAERYGLFYE